VFEADSEKRSLFVKHRFPTLIQKEVKARLVQKEGKFLRALYKVATERCNFELAALNLD
jgi:hypothetical protein